MPDLRPVGNRFMDFASRQSFDSAQLMLSKPVEIEPFFTGDNTVEHWNMAGFGVQSPRIAHIEYYVTGKPANQRNLQLCLTKIRHEWKVSDITHRYHIHRDDKAFAIAWAELLNKGQTEKAIREIESADSETIASLKNLFNSTKPASCQLLEGLPIPQTGKYHTPGLRQTEFIFALDNSPIQITIRLRFQKSYSITRMWIKE